MENGKRITDNREGIYYPLFVVLSFFKRQTFILAQQFIQQRELFLPVAQKRFGKLIERKRNFRFLTRLLRLRETRIEFDLNGAEFTGY